MSGTPTRVRIVEVGPRDGLQNEAHTVPLEVKIGLIDRLSQAGLPAIEAGAFVSPRWVPQMADSAEVLAGIARREGVTYPVLVPNLQGCEAALAAGARHLAVFAAASEAFSLRNTNCSIAESLARFEPVARAARAAGAVLRGYVSCVVGCPYQGAVLPSVVADVSRRLVDLGCEEISLGDTIGVGTPGSVGRLLECVARQVPVASLAGHFHDTYGQALANVLTSLQFGIATFDCSVAGLGGCPFARGATGNVSTEDVVYMLDGMGVHTGIDLGRLIDAGTYICEALGRPTASRAARALAARRGAP